ncbi:olfactory receptor 11A1-like [Pyxicephalus adspersus]|uniref:olfactory receptor 11A1-like n=1 Tax=Pyxicephalus adspersus TaxID=30357 RepID=UPI003B58F51C
MPRYNHTSVTEFILLGFEDLHSFQSLFFLFLLLLYLATMIGNVLIIVLVTMTLLLHSPMYYFLCHLSFCDILISTNVVPNTLQVFLRDDCHISPLSCKMQLYVFGASAIIECCLLTVMSYDRYLAICNPLHYSLIMKNRLPMFLAMLCWLAGLLLAMITELLVAQLDFCGPNTIDHFFCDLAPLLDLSCSDTKSVEVQVSIMVIVIIITPLIFVIVTYICIFTSIFRISSTLSRQKVFSTCSSHLVVVFTYYGTLITIYIAPSRIYSLNLNKVLSLFNTSLTPLFNPIIYTLRNKEIRNAFSKAILKVFQ